MSQRKILGTRYIGSSKISAEGLLGDRFKARSLNFLGAALQGGGVCCGPLSGESNSRLCSDQPLEKNRQLAVIHAVIFVEISAN